VRDWVEHARYLLAAHPRARVMIVLMDRGDVRFGRRIHAELGEPERAFVLDGQSSNPAEISAALGEAESLTSSRYHALVLSAAYAVPAVALGHDNRTRFFCEDLGLERYWVSHETPDPAAALRERHEALLSERGAVRERIRRGFEDMKARDARNYELLGDVLHGIGYRVEPVAPSSRPAAAAGAA
jgi:polysaccharide pyruvyl transferase WcaK-like protein